MTEKLQERRISQAYEEVRINYPDWHYIPGYEDSRCRTDDANMLIRQAFEQGIEWADNNPLAFNYYKAPWFSTRRRPKWKCRVLIIANNGYITRYVTEYDPEEQDGKPWTFNGMKVLRWCYLPKIPKELLPKDNP